MASDKTFLLGQSNREVGLLVGKKIQKVALPKWVTGTLSKIEIMAYNRRRKPLMAMKIQRRKPYPVVVGMTKLTKNPDKIVVDATREFGDYIQVFYYRDNPTMIFIAKSGDFVRIPKDAMRWLRKTLSLCI